jgi:hypothetical protein
MSAATQVSQGPRIYNLFPLLAGPLPRWKPHLERARRMEFDWLFVNPIKPFQILRKPILNQGLLCN